MERIKRATTSVAAVYGGDLKGLPLAVPSEEEQTEICIRLEEKLAQVEAVASWCQTELTRSAALRQSILKDAFAGRLVPQDPTDESAAALRQSILKDAFAGRLVPQDPTDESAAALLARIKETRATAPGKTRRKARA